MADKKKIDPNEVFYYMYLFADVIGLIVFAYMKLNDRYFWLNGSIFCCYTMGFMGASLLMTGRILTLLNKNKWAFNLRIILMTAAAVITLVCGINSMGTDIKRSKDVRVLTLAEKTEESPAVIVFLSEYTGKKVIGTSETIEVTLDVYTTGGRMAKKIGTIDESLFANKCVETDSYTYAFDEESGMLTLTFLYGSYGDGTVMMVPAADTGSVTYNFKLT